MRLVVRRLLTGLVLVLGTGCSVSTEPPDPVADARRRIEAFADNPANLTPTVADFVTAGIQGVTEENVAEVNAAISAATRTDVDTTTEIQAIVDRVVSRRRIIGWADGGGLAPSLMDYVRVGAIGVTAANVGAINAAISALEGGDVDTVSEVQGVVDRVLVLLGIVAYADDDRTNPVPSVATYAAAGITGVTSENLGAVNAAVQAAAGPDIDTAAKLQRLVNQVRGLVQIAAYAANDANPLPTLESFQLAGVTGVTAENLTAVNRAIAELAAPDVDTIEEVQALVDRVVAQLVIVAYATSETNPAPTVQTYQSIGVSGVTATNLAAVNAAVAALSGPAVDTTAEVQLVVNRVVALLQIVAYATDDVAQPTPTAATYATAGITGVTNANVIDVNRLVAALEGPDVDTVAEVQAVVNRVAALLRIVAYATDDAANPAPTLATFAAIGAMGVTSANLTAVNAAVAAQAGPDVDTTAEVQALIDRVVAQLVIVAYASSEANPAPTLATYATAGLIGVTAANLAAVNAAVAALTGPDVDTVAEGQAVVNRVVAQLVIVAHATDDVNPAPTLMTYQVLGITGVTTANLAAVNAAVAALAGGDVDTVAEVQSVVTRVVAQLVIVAYATNEGNPAPQLATFTTVGVTGVTDANLGAVRAAIAALTGPDVDMVAEVQAVVDRVVAQLVIVAYATTEASPVPTVTTYATAGVTGVVAANLGAVNAAVVALAGPDVDTLAEVQAVVDRVVAQLVIVAYATDDANPAPTADLYAAAGVIGVTVTNLADVNREVAALTGSDVDSVAEVQVLVNRVVALLRIVAYAIDATDPAPTVETYVTIGVTGVTVANLADVNRFVAALNGPDVDTRAEVQGVVNRVAAQLVLVAYATSATNPAPTVETYAAAGVTGVTAGNVSAVNAAVAALTGPDVDTVAEAQAVVDRVVAQLMIVAYATNETNPAPTVEAYATAGVSGVTAANLTAVNAAVAALTGPDVDTVAEVQAVVNRVVAQLVVVAYATSETNPAPTLETYQAIGVTGVTAANLSAVNAAVAALAGPDVDTVAEVQAVVNRVVAQLVIVAYATSETNPAPTVETYATIGVTGVGAGNLADVNRFVAALEGPDVDTAVEVQGVVNRVAAQLVLVAYATSETNPAPTLATYATIGVTGVTAGNLSAVNAAVAALAGPDVDTTAEVQVLVDRVVAQLVVVAYATSEANPAPTASTYAILGITGVTALNLADVNREVAALGGPEVDTVLELQAVVDRVAAQLAIVAYAASETSPAPTISTYAAIGVTGVTAANLSAVNAAVAALAGPDVDTVAEVQAVVTRVVAQLVIVAYATSETSPAPVLATYATIGVTGVTAGNLSAVNAAVAALTAPDVDTVAEVQAVVNRVVAQLVLVAYATSETSSAPTVTTYATAGVTGVTAANLTAVNAAVAALTGPDVDTVAEVQAVVNRVVAQLVVVAYATSETNPAPTLETYQAIGVTGVITSNLAAVNGAVAALAGPDVDTAAEVQAVVNGVLAQLVIVAYATNEGNAAPVLATYATLGVTGVTAGNLSAVNAAVAALTGPDVDTVVEVQAVVNRVIAQLVIAAYATSETNPVPTTDTYTTAGITGVTAANLAAVNAAIVALTGSDVDTPAELQAQVDRVLAVLQIAAYAADDAANAAPTVERYAAAGVIGVTAANLTAVNTAVAALTGPDVDTTAELQVVVNRVAAQLRIVAYATDDLTNPAPALETYVTAGVTGLTAAMVPGMNGVIAALTGPEVDTVTEVQGIADGVIAEAAIAPAFATFALERATNAVLDSTVTGVTVGDTIRLVVPKIIAVTSLVPSFTLTAPRATVTVTGVTQVSGTSAGNFTTDVRYAVTSIGGTVREYVIRVIVWTGLPVVTLNTDGGASIVSREVYIPGSVSVYGGKDRPDWTFSTVPTQVRGRGHSTWYNPKKPYRLKLTLGRSLFGFPSNRDWVLLANYWDPTLARNATTALMSQIVGMAYTPRCQPVELVLNGAHQGSYQLCDQVETATNRVPAGTGGWMLEMTTANRLEIDDVSFQTPQIATFSQEWQGTYFVYKTPDPPNVAQDSVIQEKLLSFEANLFGPRFADPDSGYATRLDVESLVDWYLVQELTKNNDAMFKNSVYLYGTSTGKITFGPLWDFDLAYGIYPYLPNPDGANAWRVLYSPWIARLIDANDRPFINRLKAQWQVLYAQRTALDAAIVDYTARLRESQRLNHALWAPYDPAPLLMAPGAGGGSVFTDADYDAAVQAMRSWLSRRFAWMNGAIMDL